MASHPNAPGAIRVNVFSHHFVVYNLTYRTQEIVKEYARRFINIETTWIKKKTIDRYGKVKYVSTPVTKESEKYYHEIKEKIYEPSVFRFHRFSLGVFTKYLASRNITEANGKLSIREKPIPEGKKVNYRWISTKTDRENQPEVISFCLDRDPHNKGSYQRTKAVSLQTGKGKTYCSLRVVCELGKRALVMMPKKYIDGWLIALKENFDFRENELIVLSDKKTLRKYLEEGIPEENQMIILTTSTWVGYLNDYLEDFCGTYPVLPHEFIEFCQIGTRIIDEVHELFNSNFSMDLYTNLDMSINLSATIDPKRNAYRNKMLGLMMPAAFRICPEYDRYIDVKAYAYDIQDCERRVRYRGFANMYSHIKFENSILNFKKLTQNYFKFIMSMMHDCFLKRRSDKHKLLLLFHQKEMCDAFYKYLKQEIKDLTVCSYHGDTETTQEDIREYDIICSTKSSCGTAVDIPLLLTTIMVACEESNTGNEQALGRTRKLADGTTPYFVYTFCKSVKPQVEYHKSKVSYFRPLVKSQQVIDHNIVLQ